MRVMVVALVGLAVTRASLPARLARRQPRPQACGGPSASERCSWSTAVDPGHERAEAETTSRHQQSEGFAAVLVCLDLKQSCTLLVEKKDMLHPGGWIIG